MTDVFFNPLDDGYVANPFPHLAEMREQLPVQQTLAGPWAVFRNDDVTRLLREPGLSVDAQNIESEYDLRENLLREIFGEESIVPSTSILNVDPPDHTRLRRLVSKAFTPRAIEALRPMIQDLVDQQLDIMADEDTTDLVDRLAFPLPFDVITTMLGMPPGDMQALRTWGEQLVKTLDPIIDEQTLRDAVVAGQKMDEHIEAVIAWKRENPGEDLLTALIDVEEDGDRLSTIELRDQVSLLFVAGHETTVNLIGTGIYELLRNPEQADLWRNDESLGPGAIDELLRYVSPVQFSRRITTAPLSFGGVDIPESSVVLAGLASANRDPEFWGDDADTLDLTRANASQHMSFGNGIHYCLGASLAKMEGQVAIHSFLQRFPNATEAADPHWNGRINLRGLEKLPLRLN